MSLLQSPIAQQTLNQFREPIESQLRKTILDLLAELSPELSGDTKAVESRMEHTVAFFRSANGQDLIALASDVNDLMEVHEKSHWSFAPVLDQFIAMLGGSDSSSATFPYFDKNRQRLMDICYNTSDKSHQVIDKLLKACLDGLLVTTLFQLVLNMFNYAPKSREHAALTNALVPLSRHMNRLMEQIMTGQPIKTLEDLAELNNRLL